ncbi:MAG: GTPase HflX [Candidatus Cloacimonadales bacterium]
MLEIKPQSERVFLVGVRAADEQSQHYQESVSELQHLAKTAGIEVVDIFVQNLPRAQGATYVGKGKLQEISAAAGSKDVSTLVFNNNLSPAQSRNISDATKCNVVDRTELILHIFAKHARTKQAKLQVELAQLDYSYSRLKNLWKHLSRIQGGIGFRGPGETQIEVDRREIRKKIAILKRRLADLQSTAETKRKKRSDLLSISLVGYTNAGKSTLFNLLTNESRYVADQLFATLDAKTRLIRGKFPRDIALTDTIGFIRKLPHKLVESFKSTLVEVVEADLLLHVVDVTHPNLEELIEAVDKVLQEIKADDIDTLLIFNKCDLDDSTYFKFLKKKLSQEYPHSVFISAKQEMGIEQLLQKINYFIEQQDRTTKLRVPLQLPKLIDFIYSNAKVLSEELDAENNEQVMEVEIDAEILQNIQNQIEKYRLQQYINS